MLGKMLKKEGGIEKEREKERGREQERERNAHARYEKMKGKTTLKRKKGYCLKEKLLK